MMKQPLRMGQPPQPASSKRTAAQPAARHQRVEHALEGRRVDVQLTAAGRPGTAAGRRRGWWPGCAPASGVRPGTCRPGRRPPPAARRGPAGRRPRRPPSASRTRADGRQRGHAGRVDEHEDDEGDGRQRREVGGQRVAQGGVLGLLAPRRGHEIHAGDDAERGAHGASRSRPAKPRPDLDAGPRPRWGPRPGGLGSLPRRALRLGRRRHVGLGHRRDHDLLGDEAGDEGARGLPGPEAGRREDRRHAPR